MSRASQDYKSRLRRLLETSCWNRENQVHGDRDAIVPRKASSLSRYRAHRRHIRQFGGEDILVPFSSRPLTEFPSERCRKGPRLPIIPMLPRVFPEKAFSGAHIHSMGKRKILTGTSLVSPFSIDLHAASHSNNHVGRQTCRDH